MAELAFQIADPDLYLPSYETRSDGAAYVPSEPLVGWDGERSGEWTSWSPAGFDRSRLAGSGWKVHVSATTETAQRTLDVVAAACRDHGVAFKHLVDPLHFLLMHHKHGPRVQSGKFCTLYPVDVEQAGAVMHRLAAALDGMTGPHVLTDRRFTPGGVVSYRYGARVGLSRVELDGSSTQLTLDDRGEPVTDPREPRFQLPEGISDPFAEVDPEDAAGDDSGDGLLHGRYRVLGVVQHSNAGGTYIAIDETTGRRVLLKEARRHNGLHPDGTDARARLAHEHEMLRRIHRADPGLCPEPLELFSVWENDFLAMELVPGVPLVSWYSHHGVLQRLDATPQECATYLARVAVILASIRTNLDRLHALGIGFGDVSHGNILVADDGTTRFVDFESSGSLAGPANGPGTPWFRAPGDGPKTIARHDDYGLSACAQLLLFPLMGPIERDPAGRLPLLRRDVEAVAPVPDTLWHEATRLLVDAPSVNRLLPTSADLDERPADCLRGLVDQVRDGLLSMARPDRADWMFPLHPDGYRRSGLCRAYGAAGVLDALRQVGTDAALLAPFWDRLERETTQIADEAPERLAPGLRAGFAGIAWALSDAGRRTTAARLLRCVHDHPLTAQLMAIATEPDRPVEDRFAAWAGLGDGLAGIGMAQVCRADPAADHGRAVEIGDLLAAQADRIAAARHTPGTTSGLSGIALFLLSLADAVGDERYRTAAVRLMRAELALGTTDPDGTIRFHDLGGRRTIAYLGSGSAGVACALSRTVAQTGDPELAEALPRVLDGMRMHLSVQPGLDAGIGSWVYGFAEHARWAGTPDDARTAQRIATSIAKHLVPYGDGLVPLGSLESRLHSDLTTGAAGVLIALAKASTHPDARAWTVD